MTYIKFFGASLAPEADTLSDMGQSPLPFTPPPTAPHRRPFVGFGVDADQGQQAWAVLGSARLPQEDAMSVEDVAPISAQESVRFSRETGAIVARFGITLDNHVDEVWRALTTPDGLINWLAPGTIEPRVGGAAKLNFVDSGVIIDSTVRAFAPLKTLEYSWSGPGEPDRPIRFCLEPVGPMTGLTLTLIVPETEDAGRAAAGWAAHLDMLAAALAGAPIKFPFERFKTARDAFRARFGQDPPMEA